MEKVERVKDPSEKGSDKVAISVEPETEPDLKDSSPGDENSVLFGKDRSHPTSRQSPYSSEMPGETNTDKPSEDDHKSGYRKEERLNGEDQCLDTPSEALKNSRSTEKITDKNNGAPDEEDIVDDQREPKNDDDEELAFDEASKKELFARLKELNKEDRMWRVHRLIKALKSRFDELYEAERVEALRKFVSEGNEVEAFDYHGDETDRHFHEVYTGLKNRINKYFKELEDQKEENLKKKRELLERLREVVDGEESTTSINAIKEIQTEWKQTGHIPGAHNRTLWANYNALLDRFYDQRSIYFELKDLDRKKNLKIKEGLCEKAEELAEKEDLKAAIAHLSDLHEEYKHAGPVPKENRESIWQRFKAASDSIYARKKEYFHQLKAELENNCAKKKELAGQAGSFAAFQSDKIADWNAKTKAILDLQKQWKAIGSVQRDKSKVINRLFWDSFKTFFANKNHFFKQLDVQRRENLKSKQELIDKAESLKESDDWDVATQKFKELMSTWNRLGPVPQKVRTKINKIFRSACDHFFDRRRSQDSEQEKEYVENMNLKLHICDQIKAISEQQDINLNDVYDLIDNYIQIGFVPYDAIKTVQSRFDEAVKKILSLEDLRKEDRVRLKNHIYLRKMSIKPGQEHKMQQKEDSIRRKISRLENDISTWNTNVEFFASSEVADKLKSNLQKKINTASNELENLKSQLNLISSS